MTDDKDKPGAIAADEQATRERSAERAQDTAAREEADAQAARTEAEARGAELRRDVRARGERILRHLEALDPESSEPPSPRSRRRKPAPESPWPSR